MSREWGQMRQDSDSMVNWRLGFGWGKGSVEGLGSIQGQGSTWIRSIIGCQGAERWGDIFEITAKKIEEKGRNTNCQTRIVTCYSYLVKSEGAVKWYLKIAFLLWFPEWKCSQKRNITLVSIKRLSFQKNDRRPNVGLAWVTNRVVHIVDSVLWTLSL